MPIHTMLACRSHFSLGESTLTVEDLVDEAVRVGATACALTDTMTVSGMIDFTNRCAKAGITPIIGCRLRLIDDPAWRKTKDDKKPPPNFFVTWYVLSEAGLKALFRLLTLANSEARFYNEAKLSFDDLFDALATLSEDDVAIAFSDVFSVTQHERATEIAERAKDALTRDNVFVQLTPVDTPYFDTLNARALQLAAAGGLPVLAAAPVCYQAGAADGQDILQGIMRKTEATTPWFWSNHVRDWHALTEQQMAQRCIATAKRLKERRGVTAGRLWAEALTNTAVLVDKVTYQWAKAPVSLPTMASDEDAAVLAACKEGWARRFAAPVFGHKPSKEELATVYRPRLAYELKVLRELKFAGYFLLVQDVVATAKAKGILVGPGRGSVGGSLIAYLMGITDCDPIRFNLLFERFINPERNDLPDADLDFMSSRRGEVVDYLTDKYGQERVAGISNYTILRGASSLRDVGRILGLDEFEYRCSKLVPRLHGQPVELAACVQETLEGGQPNPHYVPEIARFAAERAPVWQTALALEGTMRSLGRHAAGIVVGGCDLVERAVVERREGLPTINWDKRIVEDMGLVKMDILGLETLDVIALTLDYIRRRHSKRVNLMAVPLDDPKVLDAFAAGMTVGVFQFESGGMRRLLKDLGRDGDLTFEDAVAATALYRPGPMDSGMLDSYVRRKQGEEAVEYDHPLMAEALSTTYGVMVYQEQVMRISQLLAGFSGAEADKLRKAMGKKDPKLMAEYREKFVAGCAAQATLEEAAAGALFDKIAAFAGYGFNRSHSVEYTLISYQCMWLKVHYPVEFITACLSLMKEERLPALVADADKMGLTIRQPDINLSTDQFEILNDTTLLIPFNRIKGVSTNTAAAILKARSEAVTVEETSGRGRAKVTTRKVHPPGPFTDMDDFLARVEKRRCNAGVRAVMERVGVFASIVPGSPPAGHPDRVRDQKELIPGLVMQAVCIGRAMPVDAHAKGLLGALVNGYLAVKPGRVKPVVGRAAKFVVVTDAPSGGEERVGSFAHSQSFEAVAAALAEADLGRADAYWTGLIKEVKKGDITPAQLKEFAPVLDAELEILKPPVIVLLGSAVARHFIPDLKGNVFEHCGKVVYDKGRDCNLVVGFAPGQIFFDPSKQEQLNALFCQVAEML
ncbi:DNA polymerase III alpha subunit (EC 2.7.7.7) [Azospirillum argentinense]|uniref:DNA polymerase III subunit alpha n=1 Tax=Azospirillum argentinense TaxID=2970906 RepID=UPI0032DE3727